MRFSHGQEFQFVTIKFPPSHHKAAQLASSQPARSITGRNLTRSLKRGWPSCSGSTLNHNYKLQANRRCRYDFSWNSCSGAGARCPHTRRARAPLRLPSAGAGPAPPRSALGSPGSSSSPFCTQRRVCHTLASNRAKRPPQTGIHRHSTIHAIKLTDVQYPRLAAWRDLHFVDTVAKTASQLNFCVYCLNPLSSSKKKHPEVLQVFLSCLSFELFNT